MLIRMGLLKDATSRLLIVLIVSRMADVSCGQPSPSNQDECQTQGRYKSAAGFCCALCSPDEDVVSECTAETATVCRCKEGYGRLEPDRPCSEQGTGVNGWIFWAVGGGTVVVVLASLAAFCCYRKRRNQQRKRRRPMETEVQCEEILPKDPPLKKEFLSGNVKEIIEGKIDASEAAVWKAMGENLPQLRECIDLGPQLFTERLCGQGIITEEARDVAAAQSNVWRRTDYILQTVVERGEASAQKLLDMFSGIMREQASAMQALASRYGCSITFNKSTAHPNLLISEDLKMATKTEEAQPCRAHEGRFDHWHQALCSNYFSTGQHYWEVDVSNSWDCRVGVAYETISRKGAELGCALGCNRDSWALRKDGARCIAMHGRLAVCHVVHEAPQRVGVYVNCDEGVVAFYIAEPRRLFHSFHANFARPLCFAVHLHDGSVTCIDLR
ncbi:B box and SPRY domain-containing protein-like [Lethenteron reissneri]|uniref:B box and SPRY domain-containing protein-like n=1 Tax=Lethenteron reissneri TaxID=7753 RepID=UPI002AB7E080|nr:B box and SPRY domain-containing protein-like [Lethenteron reissneri]